MSSRRLFTLKNGHSPEEWGIVPHCDSEDSENWCCPPGFILWSEVPHRGSNFLDSAVDSGEPFAVLLVPGFDSDAELLIAGGSIGVHHFTTQGESL